MADESMFTRLERSRRPPRKPPAAKPMPAKDGWTVIVPVPKIAPPPPAEHFKHGKPAAIYTYRDSKGWEIGYIWRFDLKDGAKEFAPLTYCRHDGDGKPRFQWRWKSWPEPRPLYGLDRLAKHPDRPVVVCEGEKAADAAGELLPGYVAITSPHGSQSAGKADWRPLAGRQLVIWPDADEAGEKYAEAVKKRLAGSGAAVKTLAPPEGVKPGWDAADALAEGWDRARAAAFLATAATTAPAKAARRSAPGDRAGGEGEAAAEGGDGDGRRRRPRQADTLLDLVDGAELWHSPDQTAYATVPVNGHFENWGVRSKGFQLWLAHQFFRSTGRAASNQATQDALGTIESRARCDGAEHTPYLRIGEHGEDVYVDLADAAWRAVRITAAGWKVVERPIVKFIRAPAMLPLPEPEAGGVIEELREFANVATEGDFKLIVAWLVGAFHPRGPYPVLALYGAQGSGKTSLARLVRSLVDPSRAPDRAPPRDEPTLCLAAKNSWVVATDNLSSIPPWLSDAMCRLSTGGGLSSRILYTDDEELLRFFKRPQMFTAIPEAAVRADLSDRAIAITTPTIAEADRRAEAEFNAAFEPVRPRIFGALLDAVKSALQHRGEVPAVLTRMADWVIWISAARHGLGWHETGFIDAYLGNRKDAVDAVLDADGLSQAIIAFIEAQPLTAKPPLDERLMHRWAGTSTELLDALPADEKTRKTKSWPAANQVRNRLRRLQAALRAKSIELDLDSRATGRGRERLIVIAQPADTGDPAD